MVKITTQSNPLINKLALPLLFLLCAGSVPSQGLATLYESATLVVEGRVHTQPPTATRGTKVMVTRIFKGPSKLESLRIQILPGVSAHQSPSKGKSFILFLKRLGAGTRRVYGVIQRPLALLPVDHPSSKEVGLHLTRLSAIHHHGPSLLKELLRTLSSKEVVLLESAAADLVARPSLLALADEEDRKSVLRNFNRTDPTRPACRNMAHLIGEIRPQGWERVLADSLSRGNGTLLSLPVGTILAHRIPGRAAPFLIGRYKKNGSPGVLLALGATRLPGALAFIKPLLDKEEALESASMALSLHRTKGALKALTSSFSMTLPSQRKRAGVLLGAMASMARPEARKVLEECARGARAPFFRELATKILKRKKK